jgi:uncharacterized protein YdhG (YjbR/CyaY superfamily)
MRIQATSVDDYIQQAPEARQEALRTLRALIQNHLPAGFLEGLSYGMPGYVVPHEIYPPGYHCDPKLPLPFLSFANQKNFIALYHMGLYANEEMMAWFTASWDAKSHGKLDMGKSCIRFKNVAKIPWGLLEELVAQMTPRQWVELYESKFVRP